ncbi:MAG: methylthioribulose 1-phosphate dehydratase [Acidiferrobacter sp.]
MTDPRPRLVELGARFYQRGWMWATSGNLSARADDQSFWITASGQSKGALTPAQFVRVAIADGATLEAPAGARPSAESAIHRAIYRQRPTVACCLHVHTVAAIMACPVGDQVPLPAVEMVKALGVWSADAVAVLPVFANHADVGQIGEEVFRYLGAHPQALPAIVVRDHGSTAWGPTIDAAVGHLEAVEFLLTVRERSSTVRGTATS